MTEPNCGELLLDSAEKSTFRLASNEQTCVENAEQTVLFSYL
jgi:hypothetical protein